MTVRAPILSLAYHSLANRAGTVLLTLITIAISVTLFVGVEKIRHGARASFQNTISGVDLIVGARSSSINLLLYSVFHIGDATNNISWESYQTIANARNISWTVPISLGDSHRGYRVVGTSQTYFDHYQYGRNKPVRFAQGERFAGLFETVIGAEVARALDYTLDEEVIIAHGLGEIGFIEHGKNPFRIVGILERTGTPIDRSVFVSLEAIEAIHLGGATGPGVNLDEDELQAYDLSPDAITAFYIGLPTPVAALQFQRAVNTYREEALQAVMPGIALEQLWNILGAAERTLAIIAAFVVLTGLFSILTVILTSLNERRREMAILRALGARPVHIFQLLIAEAGLIAFAGSILGLALTHVSLSILTPWIEARYGLFLSGLTNYVYDIGIMILVILAAMVLSAFPAWRAYRTSLSDGMSIRL